jgi:hypothetical protein
MIGRKMELNKDHYQSQNKIVKVDPMLSKSGEYSLKGFGTA